MDEKLNRNINDLHPKMRVAVRRLEEVLLDMKLLATARNEGFQLFEGYRSPERQAYLRREHPKVTKAGMWQSSHQYGLAVDYVWRHPEAGWSWEDGNPWWMLDMAVAEVPELMRPIQWDRPHIEHRAWHLVQVHVPRR